MTDKDFIDVGIDRDALAGELEWIVPGFYKMEALEKFADGQSNPTYLVTAASGKYVLRAKPPGELLKSAHQVDREYRVMKALEETEVPVPRALALTGEDSAIGRMYFVMDFVDGRIFWDPALPECANEERTAIFDAMNGALAALHDVDPATVDLQHYGRPGNYFERQVGRWAKQYRASQTDPIPDMDALIGWLEETMPEDGGESRLVHGDYRIDNMIFAKDEPKILALLDWELSTLGHPFADLAYQCMQWRLPNDGDFRGLGGIDRAALGIPSEQEYVANYCRRRGIDGISNWEFFLAFSFFRLAAILQGVYKRALDGNASNPERALKIGRSVPMLAAQAMTIVKEGA